MKRFQFWAGFFCGVVLLGGVITAADAASGVIAALSSQPIFVDGQRVSMTAYAINGNNYVRLRDIGKAVDFGVTYDAATNSVHIDPDAPYQEQVSQPAPSTPAPSAVTEESVRAALDALKTRYPHGSTYPAPYHSTSNGPYGAVNSNCAGWAILCSDAAFGNLPWRKMDFRWEDVRGGDLIQYDNNMGSHVIVVRDKTDEWIYFTDSNPSHMVYWIGGYTREWLEQRSGLVLYTRYPS